ncbi:MAG: DUF4293 family protein, partial [Chitinophagales bacterium]
MIQRIQSIFLFLASGVLGAFSFLEPSSLASFDGFEQDISAILSLTGAALSLIVVFLFKKRKLQLSLSKVAIAFALLAIIPLLYYSMDGLFTKIPFYLLPLGF